MIRMSGADANFLYQETPTALMHTLKIEIFEGDGRAAISIDLVKAGFLAMLHRVPLLRRRVVFVPFKVHHPVLIEDPDFNLDFHLCRAALPAPGGRDELDAMIAQIASYPLDRNRPLWELWIVHGYEGGKVVVIHKIHHAMADGMASVRFLTSAFGNSPAPAPPQPWVSEPIPGSCRLLRDALWDHLRLDAPRFPQVVKQLYQSVVRMKHNRDTEDESPVMESLTSPPPRLRWNYALTSKRVFATRQVPLARVRQFKGSLQASVNDVVMAMASSALRGYLLHHKELPQQSLLASVPVGVDEPGTERDWGNRVSSLSALLWTNIADPLERFRAIQQSIRAGKVEFEALGRDTFGNLLQYLPPALTEWSNRRKYKKRTADHPGFTPMTNIVISNVPGPREEFSGDYGRLLDLFSMGVLIEGCGLNITVWSYAGNLNFSLMGCMKAVPDIQRIANGLEVALRELETATVQPADGFT